MLPTGDIKTKTSAKSSFGWAIHVARFSLFIYLLFICWFFFLARICPCPPASPLIFLFFHFFFSNDRNDEEEEDGGVEGKRRRGAEGVVKRFLGVGGGWYLWTPTSVGEGAPSAMKNESLRHTVTSSAGFFLPGFYRVFPKFAQDCAASRWVLPSFTGF